MFLETSFLLCTPTRSFTFSIFKRLLIKEKTTRDIYSILLVNELFFTSFMFCACVIKLRKASKKRTKRILYFLFVFLALNPHGKIIYPPEKLWDLKCKLFLIKYNWHFLRNRLINCTDINSFLSLKYSINQLLKHIDVSNSI